MIVHIESAGDKWCPMTAIFKDGKSRVTNRGEDVFATSLGSPLPGCLGDQCMWWVWDDADNGGCGIVTRGE